MASTSGPNGTTTTTTTAVAASSSSSSARQSARQIRTNPSRLSKTAGRTSLAQQYNPQTAFLHPSSMAMMGGGFSSSAAGVAGPVTGGASSLGGGSGGFHPIGPGASVPAGMPHDIYPGITHFTDTLFAIPREFRRHESLLKEVDGKSWALEERLPVVLGEAGRRIMEPAKNGVRPAEEETAEGRTAGQAELPEVTARRQLFQQIRNTLSDLLPTMDEKNHVARNANKELKKQMQRLETAYTHAKGEISEETRLGNLNHWAYSNKATAKAAGTERPRRDATNRDRHADHEPAPPRKQRRNQADPDDDARVRRAPAAKGKVVDAAVAVETGGPAKRRKVEKPPPAAAMSTAMERTTSTNTNRGGAKDTDTAKRRNRAPNTVAATTQRKRTNTITSTAGSPSVAPSPLVSTVGTAGKAASPAPSLTHRPQSSRIRPDIQTNGRQRPSSSASNRPPSMLPGPPGPTPNPDMSNLAPEPEKPTEGKGAHKDQPGTTASGLNGAARPASKSRDTKREDATSGLSVVTKMEATQVPETLPPPSRARSSKTSTPVVTTFAESQQQQQRPQPPTQRTRPTRSTDGPAKRSHKKGASNVSAIRQVIAAAAEEEDISHQGDDEDEEGEPRYCYCNQVSFGEMVACDNDACPREWFHLMCVGLAKPPLKNETWYCNECKDTVEAVKKTKTRGGR